MDKTEPVLLLRMMLPESERVVDETPRPSMPDSQRTVSLSLTSWRLPKVRKQNDPSESTAAREAPPANQIGTLP